MGDSSGPNPDHWKTTTGLLVLFAIIVAGPLVSYYLVSESLVIVATWLAGARALGLLSGYTTGASRATGTAGEFLKFLSGGVLVPLVGGIAGLLQRPQKITERYTYAGDQLVEKITETALASPFPLFQPLVILGSFLLVYGLLAIAGIILGARHRVENFVEIQMKV